MSTANPFVPDQASTDINVKLDEAPTDVPE
jgi:hypothetical protein